MPVLPDTRTPVKRTIDRSERRGARLVAAALRGGRASANDAFDRFLPDELRLVSDRYWTPLSVVRRAAHWLREAQVRRVVDMGSGAGKFCVGAALLTRCEFIGVERRAPLVAAADDLAAVFGVDDRVRFVTAELDPITAPVADAYYFFNPFGDYTFNSDAYDEPGMDFTPEDHRRGVAAVTALLSRAAAGTFVITYNGFGGTMPSTYEQIDVAQRQPGTLRLWKQRATP